MAGLPSTAAPRRDVRRLLRVAGDTTLLPELVALFSYSISRALDSLEAAPTPEVRLAITRGVITPLERARDALGSAIVRQGCAPERALIGAEAVDLAHMQLRVLVAASRKPGFPWELLPEVLGDPGSCLHRLDRALGRVSGIPADPVYDGAGTRGEPGNTDPVVEGGPGEPRR
ncbi:MAG: hypothetical protein PVH31_03810 [Ectothiorhodospiraceae bacterium]|jgi:hypothetical protein